MQEVTILDLKETKGRILGVDFGDTRTGLAVSDTSRFLASGIGYVSPGGIVKTADKVAEVAREQKVSAIVVGLPKNMDGSEGPRAEKARAFKALLEETSGLPVELRDERRSSIEAHQILHAVGKKEKSHRKTVDAVAASLILEAYLGSI